ncbi:cyclin-T1-like isoform X2 [Narcine bancroftii]|uniref:cyclin-T1-like isoform X2 n=1 Tax=Narcine bancroftii TaxID=1343680 RepID=UPI0038318A91
MQRHQRKRSRVAGVRRRERREALCLSTHARPRCSPPVLWNKMAAGSLTPVVRWCFTRQQLQDTPSRRGGVDWDKELSYRQQAANLVQDMGQRLSVSQLTINTAIVYMHRFYMQQCFTKFHRNTIAPATLFLAAKVEEQPRKLEHVIKVAHACLNPQEPPPDIKSEAYLQEAQDLVILESVILQTLASKDLAQTSYFMATNSLHLTTFCLQYQPPVVACVCIHLACKWSNWEIPVSTDGKNWWEYVDPTVTLELLDELTHEFLQILEKTPNRLKRIKNWRACQAAKKPKLEDRDSEEGCSELPSQCAGIPCGDLIGPVYAGSEDDRGGRRWGGAAPQRVSLNQYRAKRAEELAWQRQRSDSGPAPQRERDRRPRQYRLLVTGAKQEQGEAVETEEDGSGGRREHPGSRHRRRESTHRHRHHHHQWARRGEVEGGEGHKRNQLRPGKMPGLYPHSSSSRPLEHAPVTPDTNGHGASHSHYQDTFNMLESLLTAQGVPRGFQHSEELRAGSQAPGGGRPPPLPDGPPPPLPPLPK